MLSSTWASAQFHLGVHTGMSKFNFSQVGQASEIKISDTLSYNPVRFDFSVGYQFSDSWGLETLINLNASKRSPSPGLDGAFLATVSLSPTWRCALHSRVDVFTQAGLTYMAYSENPEGTPDNAIPYDDVTVWRGIGLRVATGLLFHFNDQLSAQLSFDYSQGTSRNNSFDDVDISTYGSSIGLQWYL